MDDRLNRIQQEILDEHERDGRVDACRWLSAHPEFAGELLDFIMWLDAMPQEEEPEVATWVDERSVAEEALQQALAAAAARCGDPAAVLAAEMARVRADPTPRGGGRAPDQFRRAVVYSWAVERMAGRRRVSRLATQKAVYFLERGLNLELFGQHRRMPLGPYDSGARYKDAEPIALKKRWIRVRGSSLEPDESSAELGNWVGSYVIDAAVAERLVDLLAHLDDSQLETLATVDAVAVELREAGEEVSVHRVLERLASIPEWTPKLARPHFRGDAIAQALARLQRLGLLSRAQPDG